MYFYSPNDINGAYGFRTRISSTNDETWKYCNLICSKILMSLGIVLLVVTFIFCVALGIKDLSFTDYTLFEVITLFFALLLVLIWPLVNILCKKRFPSLFIKDKIK